MRFRRKHLIQILRHHIIARILPRALCLRVRTIRPAHPKALCRLLYRLKPKVSNIRDSLQYDYVSVVGGRLYYEIKGTGHPIVLIHAGFLDRRMWDEQFEFFAKDFKVIRYDVRGFGKSSRPAEKYSDIEDLHTLLTSLKVEKTYLVGVSNGGRIAIDFTINHQSIVGALILVGSGVSGYETSEPEEDKAWAEFDKQIDEPQQLAAK